MNIFNLFLSAPAFLFLLSSQAVCAQSSAAYHENTDEIMNLRGALRNVCLHSPDHKSCEGLLANTASEITAVARQEKPEIEAPASLPETGSLNKTLENNEKSAVTSDPELPAPNPEEVKDDEAPETIAPIIPDMILNAPLTFKAIIKYPGFDKPLTSCRAVLVNETQTTRGKPFLVEQNNQTFNPDEETMWPEGTLKTDSVRIDFSTAIPYSEADCQKYKLTSADYEAQTLYALLSGEDPIIDVTPNHEIFVAFVNLQSERVHRSVARWRETLGMVNEIYRTGVASEKWSDGIILGVDENGKLISFHISTGNFSDRILTQSGIIDLAGDLSLMPQRGFSADSILSEINTVYSPNGHGSVLYVSDQFPSCRAALRSIKTAAFDENRNMFFVLAVSDTSIKTGASTLMRFNKISACNSGTDKNSGTDIVAFDLFERAANLDWANALEQAETHAKKMEFSVDKF